MSAEKRGHLVKLENNYNTSGVLEIFMKGKWYRVTSNDFRSFNGKRRITEPEYCAHGNVNIPLVTYDYDGPVFAWGTNDWVPYTGVGEIVGSERLNERNRQSQQRR